MQDMKVYIFFFFFFFLILWISGVFESSFGVNLICFSFEAA